MIRSTAEEPKEKKFGRRMTVEITRDRG